MKKAEIDLTSIKAYSINCAKDMNDKENYRSNKSKLTELRKKKKEAENLLFNEKITKDQYNNLLEILKAIQTEEKEIEEKSQNLEINNNFIPFNEAIDSLEKIIFVLKDNVVILMRDSKVYKKKLKQVKEEKKILVKEVLENKENLNKVEEYYQNEFTKLIKKVEEIEVFH